MALPALLRKLFKSSGYGSELNDGIISKIISNQDWSNSYDYPVGVVARGSDDVLYYSVAQSGPGTSAGAKDPAQGGNSGFWKSIGSGDSIPTGTVLWLSTSTVPAGYLLCNGSAVGRATYPELFAAIGTTYGAGDGNTTFNLPNLIDKFVEGSTTPGTVKAAGLPNITGQLIDTPVVSSSGCYTRSGTSAWRAMAEQASGGSKFGVTNFSANNSNSIYGNSSTVQPPALTLLPCIKAFSSVVGDAMVVVGQLVNEIQSKVALDGSNTSAIGGVLSEYMAHAAMPSDRIVNLSLPASGGTITAPADGYIYVAKHSTDILQFLDVSSLNSSNAVCLKNSFVSAFQDSICRIWMPVYKGQKVLFTYNINGALEEFNFVYANGAL